MPTPTATKTPPQDTAVAVNTAGGWAGQRVTFWVTLFTGGYMIAGVQNDIGFDSVDTPIADYERFA